MSDTLSPEVVKQLRARYGVGADVGPLSTQRLSPNNPIFKVAIGERAWAVKQTADAGRELAVAAIFDRCGIPGVPIERLSDGWLCMTFLPHPTVEAWIASGPAGDPAPLMRALGAAAMQSDLVGMRDRNLRNMLYDEARGRIILLDYERAFCAGIADRLLRPGRYLRYLVQRMCIDVMRAMPEPVAAESSGVLLERFIEGMFCEQSKLAALSRDTLGCGEPVLRHRWTVRTRLASPRRLRSLLRRAVARAR